ncbi:MAG: response regulator, partial [Prosthecobacter sp.]
MRILVIEDEPDLARHIAGALTRQGHTTAVKQDGLEGLNAALDTKPDLIVLDLNLPSLDGFSVLARLRKQHIDSRVIILTARGDVES